jgi:hypothetical protein
VNDIKRIKQKDKIYAFIKYLFIRIKFLQILLFVLIDFLTIIGNIQVSENIE